MPGDILVKTDRASMANGLELRAPFLDYELAEFCISLPDSYKVSMSESKILLREAYREKWPDSIKKRGKQGFGAPVTEWLGFSDVEKLKEKYLKNKTLKIFSLLSYTEVQKYYSENSYKTWILLNLSIWMESHHFRLGNSGVCND
jgi:asparagine synthase (glutamine-hydrolysing)